MYLLRIFQVPYLLYICYIFVIYLFGGVITLALTGSFLPFRIRLGSVNDVDVERTDLTVIVPQYGQRSRIGD